MSTSIGYKRVTVNGKLEFIADYHLILFNQASRRKAALEKEKQQLDTRLKREQDTLLIKSLNKRLHEIEQELVDQEYSMSEIQQIYSFDISNIS